MHLVIRKSYAVVASLLVVSFAGCGSGGSQGALPASLSAWAALTTGQSRVSAAAIKAGGYMQQVDARTPLVYVPSNGAVNDVNVFTLNGLQVGQILNGLSVPSGVFVDGTQNLWVANTSSVGGTVAVFRRGGLSPIKQLTDPIGPPLDVAVAKDGTAYVADLFDLNNSNIASVQVYAPGSTSPTGSLTYPNEFRNSFITCDAAGDVFVTIIESQSGPIRVIEFPGGKQAGAKDLGVTLQNPRGITLDNAGNLLIADSSANTTITEYTVTGKPTGKSIQTGAYIEGIAVTGAAQLVIGVDQGLTAAFSWLFPSGKPETTFSCCSRIGPPLQSVYDVAIDPGSQGR